MDLFFLIKKLFGSRNDRILKKYYDLVRIINSLEDSLIKLSDIDIKYKTKELRYKYDNGCSLDDLLPESFAVVRESSKRVYGMRHFDTQILGGIALHNGKIAEMRTGEGKTLTATLPVYLNSLTGKGVHIVTVNDYLALRDSKWMSKLYNFLDLSVGAVVSDQTLEEKKTAYKADITYGTNNEFGFDYLRDNMEFSANDKRQRSLNYAIIDEVDSILIDEARTPLIISGSSDDNTDLYVKINKIIPFLKRMNSEPDRYGNESDGDFWIDEKNQQVYLSEQGHEKVELLLRKNGLLDLSESLYDYNNVHLISHIISSLKAWNLFCRDRHYVVNNNQIIIVDEFTGRLMSGRRWSDGLHQAIEAKEGVIVNSENHTLASITFQNYFRMYEKLSGMTGTADTEAYEFQEIYNLETVVIPTNRPLIRKDYNDHIYKTSEEKYKAILEDILDCYNRKQPVLVGTTSIENSEFLSNILKQNNLKHRVLNAKQHALEADIIAEAGKPGSITIATNMAGRGTDIVLGGSLDKQIEKLFSNSDLDDISRQTMINKLKDEWKLLNSQVKEAGGLHIIGTERHESRRIDNQLRGRSGRQGDPGSSCFYLSLDDSLMRIFAGKRLQNIMTRLNLPYGEPIKSSIVDRAIENAQRKVESRNFDIRKQLLDYDDVTNEQRKIVYLQRNEFLSSNSFKEYIKDIFKNIIVSIASTKNYNLLNENQVLELQDIIRKELCINLDLTNLFNYSEDDDINIIILIDIISDNLLNIYKSKMNIDSVNTLEIERFIFLQCIDLNWREHLCYLDSLRQGIHLRGYAQKNPKQEYRKEAFESFSLMLDKTRNDIAKNLLLINIKKDVIRTVDIDNNNLKKMRRNDLCYCGSGKKFKHCHGFIS